MNIYYVTRPVTIHTARARKKLIPALDPAAPAITETHIAAQNELKLVYTAMNRAYPKVALPELVRPLAPAVIAQMPHAPVALGRSGAENLQSTEEPCLEAQLHALRQQHPHRRLFRILLVNGFGSNLGDTLVGMSAFRHVQSILHKILGEVELDVLLGWHSDDRLERLYRQNGNFATILHQGITLAHLSRYQAIFDTTGLLQLPNYAKMPIVDWYLWWFGLNPADVRDPDKCTSIVIPEQALRAIDKHLSITGSPRILLNPMASTPLRTMPDSIIPHICGQILRQWPDAQIILLNCTSWEHPQAVNIGAAIPDVDHLAALVASVDALIGVDTYTQHLVAALGVPAVTIFTSVSPSIYPYYPLSAPILLPQATELPAWGKSKVSAPRWEKIASLYNKAWQRLCPSDVITALYDVMQRSRPSSTKLRVDKDTDQSFSHPKMPTPLTLRQDSLTAMTDRTYIQLARCTLLPGDSAVCLGSGTGSVPLALAERVGLQGHLIVFEPRPHLHQYLCATLSNSDIHNTKTHVVMPTGSSLELNSINQLHVADEFHPHHMANTAIPEEVVCWPLDTINLKQCALLLITSPLPLLSVLQGSHQTIAEHRPVIVVGIISSLNIKDIKAFIEKYPYKTRILNLDPSGEGSSISLFHILVAEPEA